MRRRYPVVHAATILLAACCAAGIASSPEASRPTGGENLLTFSRIDAAQALADGQGVTVAIIDWQFDLRGSAKEKYIDPVSMVPGEEIGKLKPWHGEWMAEIVHQIAPRAMIIPIKARGLKSEVYQEYLIQALYYAADHGAVAASSSMGPLKQSDVLRQAIDHAEQKGMVFIDVHPEYFVGPDGKWRPGGKADCDSRILHPGVVSVPDHPADPEPARDVYTWPYDLDAKYEDGWGYSNAPPTVVGVIALMKSVNGALTPAEIRRIIVETASEKDGFRVLDAEAAVRAALAAKR